MAGKEIECGCESAVKDIVHGREERSRTRCHREAVAVQEREQQLAGSLENTWTACADKRIKPATVPTLHRGCTCHLSTQETFQYQPVTEYPIGENCRTMEGNGYHSLTHHVTSSSSLHEHMTIDQATLSPFSF